MSDHHLALMVGSAVDVIAAAQFVTSNAVYATNGTDAVFLASVSARLHELFNEVFAFKGTVRERSGRVKE